MDGVSRHLDSLGRYTIPVEYRATLGIILGQRLGVTLSDNKICLTTNKDHIGMTRPVDHLGRVTLPIEFRRTINVDKKTMMVSFIVDGEIVIKKDEHQCVFCHRPDKLVKFKNVCVCKTCMREIRKGKPV